MSKGVWLLAAVNIVALHGCATLYEGLTGPRALHFTSAPDGAAVKLESGDSCLTPCELGIDKVKRQKVLASLSGFPEQTVTLERRFNRLFWVNLVALQLGAIGMAVDWFDGQMWTYTQDTYRFVFKESASEPEISPEPRLTLPSTPELARIKEQYPEEYMKREVGYYYGAQSGAQNERIIARLYQIMLEMVAANDALDLDEAVRRDHFQRAAEPKAEGKLP